MIHLTRNLALLEEAICNMPQAYDIKITKNSELNWSISCASYEKESNSICDMIKDEGEKLSLIILTRVKERHIRILAFDLTDHMDNSMQTALLFDFNHPDVQQQVELNVPIHKNEVSLLKKIISVPYNTPAFFTVLGPEGVGKTTLCENIEDKFKNFPVNLKQFHHTGAWKQNDKKSNKIKESENLKKKNSEEYNVVTNRSLVYRIVRTLWRRGIPQKLKNQLLPVPGELKYMINVIELLVQSHYDGNLVLTDRYCYDRLVRWENLKKPHLHRVASYLICKIMRRPFHAFVLCDKPENIFKRKQVMPVWEIGAHQKLLINVCNDFNVDYEIVDVSSMTQEHVSEYVASKILHRSKDVIFDLLETTSIS